MIAISLYYLVFFIIYWSTKGIKASDKSAMRWLCVTAFVLLFVVFGFRDLTVLNDTSHYYITLRDKINYIKEIPWYYFSPFNRYEPGYQILETIHAKLFSNPFSIIITSSLIMTVANIWLFRKLNGAGLFLCLFLLLNFQMENQYSAIRQGTATALIYVAIYNLMKGRNMVFLLFTTAASFFHITAVMVFPLLIIKSLKFNKTTIILFLAGFFIVVNFMLHPLINTFATDSTYIDTNAARESFPVGSLILLAMSIWLFVRSYCMYRKYRIRGINNIMWMVALLCLVTQSSDIAFPIIGRIAMYFFPFLVSLYVGVLRRVPDRNARFNDTLLTFVIFFTWFVTYNMLKPEWYNLYPYSFMDMDTIFYGTHIERLL